MKSTRRVQITEDDKLKAAKTQAKRFDIFLDEEMIRWKNEKIDRQMFCAAMDTWISAHREIFRIENDKRMKDLRWKRELEIIPKENEN